MCSALFILIVDEVLVLTYLTVLLGSLINCPDLLVLDKSIVSLKSAYSFQNLNKSPLLLLTIIAIV